MLRKIVAPVLAALAVTAIPASAAPRPAAPPAARPAQIAFANHGGIDDWRAIGSREIWFRDSFNRWYRAILTTPATDLPYVEHIGIDARPSGTLDRFGGIFVRGRHYTFLSFERMPGPPPKKVAHRH